MTNHRAPLAPGEIRSHVVGNRAFQVMHVAGGSYTQASYRDGVDGPTKVLGTHMFERDAVNAYADAIEQAESDAIDALEGDDTPEPPNWWERGTEPAAPAPTHADDVAALRAALRLDGRMPQRDARLSAILDRIAATAPQRSTFGEREVWQHACGAVKYGEDGELDGCSWCYEDGAWRALYVLPDGA
jgi:hypothetical protein